MAEKMFLKPIEGRIVMITLESSTPYDRIKLSKALGSTAEELALRPKTFYSNSDIEVMTLTEAVSEILIRLLTLYPPQFL